MGILDNIGNLGGNTQASTTTQSSQLTAPVLGQSASGQPSTPGLGVNTSLPSGLSSFIAPNTTSTISSTTYPPSLPWEINAVNSLFFPSLVILADRWDSLYPYRLMVIDVAKNNSVVSGSRDLVYNVGVSTGTNTAFLSILSMSPAWIYQLPITPQQLNIMDQFSINTSATLRGVLEEHNGVKFKMINAAGSFGVWAARPSGSAAQNTSPNSLQTLFGGTIAAAQNLATQVQSVIRTATTGHPASVPVTVTPEQVPGIAGLQATGYYRALALQQFLEQYAEAKKNPANATWRLVFDIPKQNQSYIVTPMQFTWQQNANRPMEISYSFQLKAWRRVALSETFTAAQVNIAQINPSTLQNILNTIQQAQTALAAATNLISAVTSDLESPLNVLRQTSIFVKGLMGVANTVANLPSQIVRAYQSSITQSLSILSSSISATVTDPTSTKALAAILNGIPPVEGLSLLNVAGGQLGTVSQNLAVSASSNNVFSNPNSFFTLLDQVPLSTLNLNPTQQTQVDDIIAQYSSLSVADLKQYRSVIQTTALQLSNTFGTGSAYYNQLFGLPPPTTRITPITIDEYTLLDTLYQVMQSYDILTATTLIDDNITLSNMEYVAGLAATSGIQFNVPNSKILAPVPFGLTIESIALRYLGDAQRWIEIATLNSLRDPYIDEDGFQTPLLSNATGRQFTVADASNFWLGQTITLYSSTQFPTSRTILEITQLTYSSFLIKVDGLANLDVYTTANKAYVQSYLPGTVNSQQKIYIPSDLQPPTSQNIIANPATTGDPLTAISDVDLLLTDSGDIAINNFGDLRFSYGLTNIMQALKIKFATGMGTVITMPTFGLGLSQGQSVADMNAQDLFKQINALIQQDPRFAGITSLQLTLNGPTLGISMAVQIAGQQGVFPVSFALT
jgi:hypothetical protein